MNNVALKLRSVKAFAALVVVVCSAMLPGCSRQEAKREAPAVLKMATTTSTDNSGLLGAILPAFEKAHNAKVAVIATGSGKAIKLGENGDVDIVFAHAPELEEAFTASGFGVNRTPIMYNYFILLGPDEDPAEVRGAGTAPEAYRRIAAAQAALVSRGDESGTHQKEKEIWAEAAGSVPKAAWLMETGQGMGPSLQIADEKRAYILTDRGTYLAYKEKISLVPVMESDETLLNPYSLIAVNPEKYPGVNYNLAMELIRWMSGEEGKAAISGFKAGGESMFFAGEMEKRD
ncbi:MAG TPA: substrate-binding domain-containing protein [bacterium]|nr:substrate-binding domain-containing protein [bacterium]